MAVLKRGDVTDTFKLDSARRFSASFVHAWNLMFCKINTLISLQWFPVLVAGIVGTVWLCVCSNSVFWQFDIAELFLDLFSGLLVLYIWSVMRIRQLDLLADSDGGKANGSVFGFFKALSPALRSFAPLGVAWTVVFVLAYLLVAKEVEGYILFPAVIFAIFILFPVAGMVQSYVETEKGTYLASLLKGLKLNVHYWGGMGAMCVLSFLLLGLVSFVLFFGGFMIGFLYKNQSIGMFMGEPIEIPAHVIVMKYVIMFMATSLLSFFQVLWSLPQQVHIRSVVYKSHCRPKKAGRMETDADSLNVKLPTD